MSFTETEKLLLLKQLRKARDEVIRGKMMMEGAADDEADAETVEDLEDIVASLDEHIDGIVKAELVDEEHDEEDEDAPP